MNGDQEATEGANLRYLVVGVTHGADDFERRLLMFTARREHRACGASAHRA